MKTLIAMVMLALAGCTTAQRVDRLDGDVEFQIACGAALGWNICYSRAQQLCPQGYKTLIEDQGFNRKELRINCGRG